MRAVSQIILSLLWWVAKNRFRVLMGAWILVPILIGLATLGLIALGGYMVLRARNDEDAEAIPEAHVA